MLSYPTNPDAAGFGIYVHWPFCAAKCPYCDFNSHVRHAGIDQASFVDGYRREIAHIREIVGPRVAGSIFFGGGTPSLMAPSTLEAILDAICNAWDLAPGAELTLEANPTSVEAGHFRDYRDLGINRVSLGVQALHDADLRTLGRLHTVGEAMAALEIAKATFERFSFDLIYARPGQSLRDWQDELARVLDLRPPHLSLYQLTIEEGTPFAGLHRAGKLKVPAPELADALYASTQELTAQAGLPAYEISNHARPGDESRHNLLYWRYGEYVGLGPGAHGRIISGTNRYATSSERLPERWFEQLEAAGDAFTEYERLTPAEQADELLLMGLRLNDGVDLQRLSVVGGVRPSDTAIRALEQDGLLVHDKQADTLSATDRGRFILNKLVLELSTSLAPV